MASADQLRPREHLARAVAKHDRASGRGGNDSAFVVPIARVSGLHHSRLGEGRCRETTCDYSYRHIPSESATDAVGPCTQCTEQYSTSKAEPPSLVGPGALEPRVRPTSQPLPQGKSWTNRHRAYVKVMTINLPSNQTVRPPHRQHSHGNPREWVGPCTKMPRSNLKVPESRL